MTILNEMNQRLHLPITPEAPVTAPVIGAPAISVTSSVSFDGARPRSFNIQRSVRPSMSVKRSHDDDKQSSNGQETWTKVVHKKRKQSATKRNSQVTLSSKVQTEKVI